MIFTWLDLIKLLISGASLVASRLSPSTSSADAKVASELNAAITSLQKAHDTAVSLDELESLRTQALW